MNEGTNPQPVRLHKIAIRRSRRGNLYILIAAVTLPTAYIGLHSLMLDAPPAMVSNIIYCGLFPLVAIGAIAALIIYDIRIKSPMLEDIASIRDIPSLKKLFRKYTVWSNAPESYLEKGGIEDFVGETFLVLDFSHSRKRPQLKTSPITVPFEPISLSDAHYTHLELLTNSPEHIHSVQSQENRITRFFKSRRKHILITSASVLLASFPFFFYLLTMNLKLARVLWILPVWILFLMILSFFVLRQNPHLLPGGLFFRRKALLQSSPQLHFTRSECITMITGSCISGTFIIRIMDIQTREKIALKITRYQLDIFLAAWLSPLPTPTLEEMPDFT